MVPSELVAAASDDKVHEPWPAQINKLVRYRLYRSYLTPISIADMEWEA